VIPLAEAQERVLASCGPNEVVTVMLDEALGAVLAETVLAPEFAIQIYPPPSTATAYGPENVLLPPSVEMQLALAQPGVISRIRLCPKSAT